MKSIRRTSQIGRKALGMAALAALLLGGVARAQTGAPRANQVVLATGTVIPVRLETGLSSSRSRRGDIFSARVDDSRGAYQAIMRGGIVEGVVRRAVPRDGDKPGLLDLSFTRLRLSDGRSYAISGSPTSLNAKNLKVRSDGILEAKTTNKDQHLTYAGYGAGAGLLVGLLGGGKIKVEDVLLGGGLGYAVGSLLKGPAQVHDVEMKSGTALGVLLGSRVQYYRKSRKAVVRRHPAT